MYASLYKYLLMNELMSTWREESAYLHTYVRKKGKIDEWVHGWMDECGWYIEDRRPPCSLRGCYKFTHLIPYLYPYLYLTYTLLISILVFNSSFWERQETIRFFLPRSPSLPFFLLPSPSHPVSHPWTHAMSPPCPPLLPYRLVSVLSGTRKI